MLIALCEFFGSMHTSDGSPQTRMSRSELGTKSSRIRRTALQCSTLRGILLASTATAHKVARAKFSARTIGECLEEFFEPMSTKTILTLLGGFVGFFFAYNSACAESGEEDVSSSTSI